MRTWSLLAALLLALTTPLQARATALVAFGGGFTIESNLLSFNDLTVSLGRDSSNAPDPLVVGFEVWLEPIRLTGNVSDLGGGLLEFELEPHGFDPAGYALQIFMEYPDIMFDSRVDPGALLTIATSGVVSPESSSAVESFFGWTALSLVDIADAEFVDFNLALSAAGQDVGALLQAGQPVVGGVGGSLSELPEPSTLLLVAAGLLALAARRQRGTWSGGGAAPDRCDGGLTRPAR